MSESQTSPIPIPTMVSHLSGRMALEPSDNHFPGQLTTGPQIFGGVMTFNTKTPSFVCGTCKDPLPPNLSCIKCNTDPKEPETTYCEDCGVGRVVVGKPQPCMQCRSLPIGCCVRVTFQQITEAFLGEATPKMPHRMKEVYAQINKHPRFSELDDGTRFAYSMGCCNGYSWAKRENNAWCRKIWTKLHLDWNTEL